MSADELLAEVLAAIGTYDPLMFSDQHRELFARAATTGARAAGSDEVIERAARAASIAWENADDGPDEWFAVARAVLAAAPPAPVAPGVAALLAEARRRLETQDCMQSIPCNQIVRLLAPGGTDGGQS